MTISNIDRASIDTIGKRVAAALKDLGEELGLTFSFDGAGRYAGQTGEVRISMALATAAGAETAHEVMFKTLAAGWGLVPTDLGRTLMVRGARYTIAGANIGGRKNPVLIKRVSDERIFNAPLSLVKAGLDAIAKIEAAEEARKKAAAAAPPSKPAPPSFATPEADEEESFVAPPRPSTAPTFNSGSPFV